MYVAVCIVHACQFIFKDFNFLNIFQIVNCGLVQHQPWQGLLLVELFEVLNLPVLPAVVQALKKAVNQRMKNLLKKQSDEAKRQRVSQKVARAEDQEERKKWSKRQTMKHSYSLEDDAEQDAEVDDPHLVSAAKDVRDGDQWYYSVE